MKPSRIELHIDRLTLDGFTLTGAQSSILQVALERELSRLLSEGGLTKTFNAGFALAATPPLNAGISPSASPSVIGRDLARTLYQGISSVSVREHRAKSDAPTGDSTPKPENRYAADC